MLSAKWTDPPLLCEMHRLIHDTDFCLAMCIATDESERTKRMFIK
jgi:hypothetical protein